MARRNKYVDDYQSRAVVDADGDYVKNVYVYAGDWWQYRASDAALKQYKVANVLLVLGMTALWIIMGTVNNPGARTIYGVLPFAVLLFPLMMLWGDLYKLLTAPRQMTRKQRDYCVVQMKTYTTAALICALLSAGCTGIFLALSQGDGRDTVFLLCSLCIATLCGGSLWLQRRFPCEATPQQKRESASAQAAQPSAAVDGEDAQESTGTAGTTKVRE